MNRTTSPRRGLELAVTIGLGGRTLLAIDAAIAPGEVLTVMGPSGSGKSTLLAWIAGFLPREFKAQGRVWIDGADITEVAPEDRHFGLLFQDPLLLPHLSVAGNLLFGLAPETAGRRARRGAVDSALAEAGLEGFGDRDPATLSGGQRARVALLRTLLSKPRALLLDEPFSKLDTALKDQIRALVFDQANARGLPVLLVTHDPLDAKAAAGRCIELTGP